eukprot:Platyproteum_vivax@DN4864_c0_g1_i1.p1
MNPHSNTPFPNQYGNPYGSTPHPNYYNMPPGQMGMQGPLPPTGPLGYPQSGRLGMVPGHQHLMGPPPPGHPQHVPMALMHPHRMPMHQARPPLTMPVRAEQPSQEQEDVRIIEHNRRRRKKRKTKL